MTAGPLLDVRELVKHFPIGLHQSVKAVNGVSFHIERGESLALVGESGSGKTTVGRCVLRLLEATAGTIRFRGEDITHVSQERFRPFRRHVQLVFQEPYDSLNPRMRIGRILDEPLMLFTGAPYAERRRRVLELLDMVGLAESFADFYPHQLSGGEQQRVGIARAIATSPDLVVLDEPTSALDVSVRAEILDLLTDLQQRRGFAYLFISHDLTAVRRVCQRVAIMYLGRVAEMGRTEEIFARPLHPYSRALLSSFLYPDPDTKLERFPLQGEIPSPINLPPGCALAPRCPWMAPECERAVPPLEEWVPGRHAACIRLGDHLSERPPLTLPSPQRGEGITPSPPRASRAGTTPREG